jgi:HNH endonuclease
MDPPQAETTRVQLLLNALFLESDGPRDGILGRVPVRWIAEWLGLDPASHFGEAALRHLVAIQLAPKAAIAYDPTNPSPRWKLVERYLAERFVIGADERVRIARLVSSTLDHASSQRGGRILATDQAAECAICRLPFTAVPMSVTSRDPYKPTWQAPEELTRAEVDHVVPISSLGVHTVRNLQVVCRACNLAKGGGLVVDTVTEIRYAASDPLAVPRVHLFRLLQWLISREKGRCHDCRTEAGELTMRPVHPTAPIARTTLALTCYACRRTATGPSTVRDRVSLGSQEGSTRHP